MPEPSSTSPAVTPPPLPSRAARTAPPVAARSGEVITGDDAPPVIAFAPAVPPPAAAPLDPFAPNPDAGEALLLEAAQLRERADAAIAATPFDAAAAQGLLPVLDELLERLRAAAAMQPAVADRADALVAALVDRGVALAGLLSRDAPGAAPPAEAAAPAPRAPVQRVLTQEHVVEARRRPWLAVLCVVVVAAGLAYHGARRYTHRPAPPATVTGAPAHTAGMARGTGKVLTALPGQRVDPAELERFRVAEEARGNVVREVAPGKWAVVPAGEVAPRAEGGTP